MPDSRPHFQRRSTRAKLFGTKKTNPGQVVAGQNVGIKEEEGNIWLVSFGQYDIGYFDLEACRVEPVDESCHME